ncbi:MAG: UvrB/UvrC motif-containing protein [Spirochaetaceae bacterium]|nr:MAG: UvrB/UvrC motif-containing protein [Spirochaetaceae bacterium]
MKCEICGARKAVIHIQQVIGKERVDLHMCEECALERGISGEGEHMELSISNMLNGLVDLRTLKEKKNIICPQCGSTWESIQKREKFGCAECYVAFNREIHFLLEKMGVQSTHRGKLPKGLSTYKRYLVDVVKLKEGLKEALKREDYEKAARIRDRIRDLENSSEDD